jgi:type VI secretion system protein ImpG
VSATLFPYYERELVFIRQLAQEFARQYPAAANRLLLEPNRSVDPHVERLIEAFALLAGRVHHKLDDEFPELTDALLSVLYPHYLAPIPSVAVVQFELDPARSELPQGFRIERHSRLHTSAVAGLPCRFRTGYPVTLWPVDVTEARMLVPPFPPAWQPPDGAKSAIRLQLECSGELSFSMLEIDKMRFYLSGEPPVIAVLYELLFNHHDRKADSGHTLQVVFRSLDPGSKAAPIVRSPGECLFPVGFDAEDGLLPYPRQSFPGYRLLTEFFAFPGKFHFLDLGGFERVRRAGWQRRLEVVIYLNRAQANLEQAVNKDTFRPGVAPVINLFGQTAEPIALTQTRSEYRVVPDVAHPRGLEVYAVDSVTSVDPTTGTTTEYQPFYSFRHGGTRQTQRTFWYATRRQATGENDRGTDVYLSLVDLDFDPRVPAEKSLVVRTLCTNRDLPLLLQQAGEDLYLELETAAPLRRVRCLRAPSLPLRPPLQRRAQWRLLSHLSLNHLSLNDPVEGREALQEILRLYDFSDPEAGQQLAAVTRQLIEGITSVSSRPVVGRTGAPTASGFCRGTEVTLEFDEQKYVGTGVFLFACVLERFLGLYVSINSFSQLVATVRQGQGVVKKWSPRAGEQQLL